MSKNLTEKFLDYRNLRCDYCRKFCPTYFCKFCGVIPFCGSGCFRLGLKYHKDKCQLPQLKTISETKQSNISEISSSSELLERFIQFLSYHWYSTFKNGFTECIRIKNGNNKSSEWRITFKIDVSKLENRYDSNFLNVIFVELDKSVLIDHKVDLFCGQFVIGDIVDFQGFDLKKYDLQKAKIHYLYFKNKIDTKIIEDKVYGIGLPDSPCLGVYFNKNHVISLK